MMGWIVAILLVVGAAFMLIASIGVARLPDMLTRMQAATKGGGVGLSFVLVALAIDLAETGPTIRALLAVVFVLLTAPVAAQVIARAAYLNGVRLWEGTQRDDLADSEDVERILEEERRVDREERKGLL